MPPHRSVTRVSKEGTVTVTGVPGAEGDEVDVTVVPRLKPPSGASDDALKYAARPTPGLDAGVDGPCTPRDDDGDGYFACDCFTPAAGCAPTDPSPLCAADCCDAPGGRGCPAGVTTPAAAAAINPGVVEKNCDGIDNNCGTEDAKGVVTAYSCGGTPLCLMVPPPSCPAGVASCGPGGMDPSACPSGTVCRNGCCVNWVP